jgi:hypothetical protein
MDPVARRDFVCDRCGYRQVTYFVPLDRNPGKMRRTALPPSLPTVGQDDVLQEILDRWWENNPKRARFHNQGEWLAFYDELKASEHEERSRLH